MSRFSILLGLAALAAAIVSPRAAQAQHPTLSVSGGVSSYDLSGTGTAGFGAVGLEFPLATILVVEPRLELFRYETQGEESRTHVFPEIQLQAELPLGKIRPFLGAGAGVSYLSSDGRTATDLTLSGTGGVRINFASGWGLGGELRIRAVDPWAGTTAGFGLSLRRQL